MWLLTQEALGDHVLQQFYIATSEPLPKGFA